MALVVDPPADFPDGRRANLFYLVVVWSDSVYYLVLFLDSPLELVGFLYLEVDSMDELALLADPMVYFPDGCLGDLFYLVEV
jgi:hypothetical protein